MGCRSECVRHSTACNHKSYGAGLLEIDFRGAPESSRMGINDWISDQTQQRITDLIAPGGVNSATRLVLANAV